MHSAPPEPKPLRRKRLARRNRTLFLLLVLLLLLLRTSTVYSCSPPDEHAKCTSILDLEIFPSPDTETGKRGDQSWPADPNKHRPAVCYPGMGKAPMHSTARLMARCQSDAGHVNCLMPTEYNLSEYGVGFGTGLEVYNA